MKKLTLPVIYLLLTLITHAQNAYLHLSVTHATFKEAGMMIFSRALNQDVFRKGTFTIPLDRQGNGLITLPLTKPQSVTLYGGDSDSADQRFMYDLYLSPGDDLHLAVDMQSKGPRLTVTGKGSSNNTAAIIQYRVEGDMSAFSGDTLPYRAMEAIRKQQHSNDSAVKTFISQYHPTPDRIAHLQTQSAYYASNEYFQFKENNKFAIRDAYHRNLTKWQAIQDSLFATISLNNDDAFQATTYIFLLRNLLLREKERLWRLAGTDPEKFSRQWYDTTAQAGLALFSDDRSNLLESKIIDKEFKGQTAQFLYALLFEDAIGTGNPKNIVKIFDHFSRLYPRSEYISWIRPYIDTVIIHQKQPLSDKTVFVPGNGLKLDSFADVLNMFKGRTVLLDMWGTWCVPCRKEILENSQAIKSYFAGRGLDYLYIANYDQGNEKNWKDLVAYFHLEGTHLLANRNLTDDIMGQVAGSGYPTYIIIKKDGSYELSKAGYPMDRQKLIAQLETALAQ